MAAIKAIEPRSVHQIQSGQVIVDLCSVVKELVENSLDAGATSLDIRFKNNGLDLIEVQDNGYGISPDNYENVALKHYTSKLSTFDDLTSLNTFGFRGEAISSLCALSNFHIVTAQADQAPKANRLDFESSGKLKGTQVVAGQKGTIASVENLFERLPVRRRDLEKNVKREYGKVVGLLHAYACISTGVRFCVKNQMPKGKSVVVFATKSNPTIKENISNVYGAKTLLALIPLDLDLEFEPSTGLTAPRRPDRPINKIFVHGYISKPVFGEGRQTPDRQMFFVNSRPCGLPQIAKAFNEAYRSFNIAQSPFIIANFEMDTNAYDVNVSPDKRTILLHDAGALIASLKTALLGLFERQDQTVPQVLLSTPRQSTIERSAIPAVQYSSVMNNADANVLKSNVNMDSAEGSKKDTLEPMKNILQKFENNTQPGGNLTEDTFEIANQVVPSEQSRPSEDQQLFISSSPPRTETQGPDESNRALFSLTQNDIAVSHQSTPDDSPNVIKNAFDRMRPSRPQAEIATITIGDKTVTSKIGYTSPLKRKTPGIQSGMMPPAKRQIRAIPTSKLGRTLRSFAAPGSLIEDDTQASGDAEQKYSAEEQLEGQSQPSSPGEQIDRTDIEDIRENESASGNGQASDSDDDYVDEEEHKIRDERKVAKLIETAEKTAKLPSEHNTDRANKMSRRSRGKDSTVELMCSVDGSLAKIKAQLESLQQCLASLKDPSGSSVEPNGDDPEQQDSPEKKLSLTVSKSDFAKMRVVGQFNLGFILAIRPGNYTSDSGNRTKDELFIIDQHASDEKYNFERLQAETVVQNQRLVRPKTLDLTAVEEEIVIDNIPALEKNGFVVEIDTSGDEPIGRRFKLISLPLSKEVVFDTRDLEELIVLLSESPQFHRTSQDNDNGSTQTSGIFVPRPSKVRKMFAMRACRSSIMIGKTLTMKQMEKVVRHMGMIDKPWNCPHGRPTMRHLMSLDQWNEWSEWPEMEVQGDGYSDDEVSDD